MPRTPGPRFYPRSVGASRRPAAAPRHPAGSQSFAARFATGTVPRILVAVVAAWGAARAADPPAIDVSAPTPVGKGSMVVLRPAAGNDAGPNGAPGDLLIHFHGAFDTIRGAMERSGLEATVVVVNQPGLSAAYTAPFRDDPALFATLLAAPARRPDAADGGPAPRWRRVTLSCFSAGYGAVREILRDNTACDRIDAIVAADSIYAGLDEGPAAAGGRHVDPRDMAGFRRFAAAAAAGEKVFVVTHSAQPTPYASTTETADFLLASLGLEREAVTAREGEEFPQVSRAGRGGFEVLGFAGESAPAHLFHLRAIDRWWTVAAERAAAVSGAR